MSYPRFFTLNSLYIAGFTQAQSPHAALIIPRSATEGDLVHIRIDRSVSPIWACQFRLQKIEGDMALSSLLKIHDGPIATEVLHRVATTVPAPCNDTFGECLPWIMGVISKLNGEGLLSVLDFDKLRDEFTELAGSSRAYATRSKFPNIKVSEYCK